MRPANFGPLRTHFRTFRGETVLIILEATLTSADAPSLLSLFEMFVAGDYTTIAVDMAHVQIGNGLQLVFELQKKGVHLIHEASQRRVAQ